jgi:hypothetical protein
MGATLRPCPAIRAGESDNKLDKAIATYEQARDGGVKRFGRDDPRTLKTLNDLAWTLRMAERNNEAIALYEQIQDVRMQRVEAENLDVLITLGDMAEAYLAAGNVEKSVSLLQRAAVAIEKRKFVHSNAERIISKLCHCYERLERIAGPSATPGACTATSPGIGADGVTGAS